MTSKIAVQEGSAQYLFSERGFVRCSPNRRLLVAVCSDGLMYAYEDCSSSGLMNVVELKSTTLIGERIIMTAVSNNGDIVTALDNGTVHWHRTNIREATTESSLVVRCAGEVTALAAAVDAAGTVKVYRCPETHAAPQLHKTLINARCSRTGVFQVSWSARHLAVLYGGERAVVYSQHSWTETGVFVPRVGSKARHFELVSDRVALVATDGAGLGAFSVAQGGLIATTSAVYEECEDVSLAAISESSACLFDKRSGSLYEVSLDLAATDLAPQSEAKKEETDSAAVSAMSDSEEEEKEGEDAEDDGGSESDAEEPTDADMEEASPGKRTIDGRLGRVERLPHPTVQPCSTPWRNLQRFLAYNNTGFITARRELDSAILNYDIEFMDRHQHKPIRFSEEIVYTCASLNEHGAIFAATGDAGVDVRGTIHYLSFAGGRNSWTISVSPDSEPVLLALGVEQAYVVNSRGILNIYSLTGLLQASVVCPGRPVSLVATGANGLFLFAEDSEGIVCHRLDGRRGCVLNGACPSRVLFANSWTSDALVWCGSSDAGLLGAFTRKGRMLLLLTDPHDRWTEMLDTAATLGEQLETAWPVHFDTTSVSAVICKIVEACPDPYPAPHLVDLAFRLPEVPSDAFFNVYEGVLRTRMVLSETSAGRDAGVLTEKEKKKLVSAADRHILELAQLSIKAERAGRLVDLARMAGGEKTIDLLIQLAKHNRLLTTVDDLERVKDDLFPKHEPMRMTAVKHDESMRMTELKHEATRSLETVSESTIGSAPSGSSWTTPRIPEHVAKESPSGILANLTPVKDGQRSGPTSAAGSSPAELAASPTTTGNPFARSHGESRPAEPTVMLDYISAMMKMSSVAEPSSTGKPSLQAAATGGHAPLGKRRGDENAETGGNAVAAGMPPAKRQSSLSSFVTTAVVEKEAEAAVDGNNAL